MPAVALRLFLRHPSAARGGLWDRPAVASFRNNQYPTAPVTSEGIPSTWTWLRWSTAFRARVHDTEFFLCDWMTGAAAAYFPTGASPSFRRRACRLSSRWSAESACQPRPGAGQST